MSNDVRLIDAGLMPYDEALRLQEMELRRVVEGESAGTIIFVQHPNVLTLGKHSDPKFLKQTQEHFLQSGVAIAHCDRGGEVTAHVPGQLVVYPILPVSALRLTVRSYVCALEKAVIKTLAHFEITSTTDTEHPGVWCGLNKICAVGIRIKNRTSMHGLALNVNNSFDLFNAIVPCGIVDRGVTSVSHEAGRKIGVEIVQSLLAQELMNTLPIKASGWELSNSLPKSGFPNTIPL